MQADLPPWITFSDFEKAEWASQMLGERLNHHLMHSDECINSVYFLLLMHDCW